MSSKVFSLFFLFRVAALITLTILFGFLFWKEDWFFSQLVVLALIVLIVVELLFFVRKTERELGTLLEVLAHDDYSRTLYQGNFKSELMQHMQNVKERYSQQYALLQHQQQLVSDTVESTGLGICIFQGNDEIVLLNQKFRTLLNVPNATSQKRLFADYPSLIRKVGSIREGDTIVLSPADYDYLFSQELVLTVVHRTIDRQTYVIMLLNIAQSTNEELNFDAWVNFGKVISHEINNGLTPVMSLSESIIRIIRNRDLTENDEKIEEACKIISSQCETLLSFNEKYRQLIKVPPLHLESMALSDSIEEAIKLYAGELSSVEVEVNYGRSDGIVSADRRQMQQVFSNLLLNSIEAMKPVDEKLIKIQISEKKEHFLIEIEDSGVGIPDDLRSSIFIPYFTTRENGSGIGLSLCRQILWKHGAQIHLKPTKDGDRGSTFVIAFPKTSLMHQ